MVEVFEKIAELLREGKTVAIASVISSEGSTPRDSGARMIVTRDGGTYFSVGGGRLEAAVVADAREAIQKHESVVKEYDLSGANGAELGMVCGGRTTVAIEVVSPPDRLVVFGAGHVGLALARLAREVGFSVTVVDDRKEYLDPARFPEEVRLVAAAPGFSGALPEIGSAEYVVVATRSHEMDLEVLEALSGRAVGYVGLVGSRRKAETAMVRLRKAGVPRRFMDCVRCPVGIAIGSKEPAEIAVSIIAEIIKVRNERKRSS